MIWEAHTVISDSVWEDVTSYEQLKLLRSQIQSDEKLEHLVNQGVMKLSG
ncbi:hypothetical protein [Komarekiella delphini-convector]|nr:hypothetical protein [Komarekiella delphini-convector]